MSISWTVLGTVFLVALAAGVGVVVLFTLGIVALGRRSVLAEQGGPALVATATACACFLACAALILYGLHIIISG